MNERAKKYLENARQRQAERERYIREEVKKWRFDTIAVHGLYSVAEAIDNNQGAIIEPIFMSSAQAYRDTDEMEIAQNYQIPSWAYSRIHNPTLGYLEETIALLEAYGSEMETGCAVTASGMSAIASATDPFLVKLTSQPAEPINFVATCQVYGGTFQHFNVRKMQERGIEVRWIKNSNDLNEWKSKIDRHSRFLYGELPTNPTISFFDLLPVINLAHENGIPFIADSTVATPALLRPIQYGADIVVQSVTKTMSASGLGIAGAVIARKNIITNIPNDHLKADFASYLMQLPNRDMGWCLSPFQALLSLTDIRTLRSRVDHLSQSAMQVARFLARHPKIARVHYLGLEDNPLHEIARRYLYLVDAEYDEKYQQPVNRYGHLMSFQFKGGVPASRKFLDGLKRIWRATDLGRIKSIATLPAISTHQQMGEESRSLASIPPDLCRLCVGGEHPDDVIADIEQALAQV